MVSPVRWCRTFGARRGLAGHPKRIPLGAGVSLGAQGSVSRWAGIPLGRAGVRRGRYPAGRGSRWALRDPAGHSEVSRWALGDPAGHSEGSRWAAQGSRWAPKRDPAGRRGLAGQLQKFYTSAQGSVCSVTPRSGQFSNNPLHMPPREADKRHFMDPP